MAAGNRPLSPHLQIYRPQISSVLSIMHRISGVFLALGFIALAYWLNALAGGPARGPYWFDESNVDWGQDLPALAAWQRDHPEAGPLRLFYFGSARPESYGVKALGFDPELAADPPPGSYAISAHYLVYLRKLGRREGRDLDWLGRYEPIDRAGYSIYLYRLGAPPEP